MMRARNVVSSIGRSAFATPPIRVPAPAARITAPSPIGQSLIFRFPASCSLLPVQLPFLGFSGSADLNELRRDGDRDLLRGFCADLEANGRMQPFPSRHPACV